MFNYTSNWEFKVILDILYDRVPILVLFGIVYAQLCPTWAADCCGLVSWVQWGVCGVQLLWLQVCPVYNTLNEKLYDRTTCPKLESLVH